MNRAERRALRKDVKRLAPREPAPMEARELRGYLAGLKNDQAIRMTFEELDGNPLGLGPYPTGGLPK
jgi:hypothetical protein